MSARKKGYTRMRRFHSHCLSVSEGGWSWVDSPEVMVENTVAEAEDKFAIESSFHVGSPWTMRSR